VTRRLVGFDRLGTLVVGAALFALGLLVLDWRYRLVFTYRDALDTAAADRVLNEPWWPWAFAAGGLALGVLGLVWLMAHLRRGPSVLRLRTSDDTGLIETDLRSVAAAAAERLGSLAPVGGVRGTTSVDRSLVVIELRGSVDAVADATAVVDAVATCVTEVGSAFPHGEVICRVVLNGPVPGRGGRGDRARIR
jgi:hypothetical protein